MTGAELKELADKARARYDAMTPIEKAQHDMAQRRSFLRGQCPSAQDYDEWCAKVETAIKAEPAYVFLAEIERLRQDRLDCQVVMDSQQTEIERLRAEHHATFKIAVFHQEDAKRLRTLMGEAVTFFDGVDRNHGEGEAVLLDRMAAAAAGIHQQKAPVPK